MILFFIHIASWVNSCFICIQLSSPFGTIIHEIYENNINQLEQQVVRHTYPNLKKKNRLRRLSTQCSSADFKCPWRHLSNITVITLRLIPAPHLLCVLKCPCCSLHLTPFMEQKLNCISLKIIKIYLPQLDIFPLKYITAKTSKY